MIDELEKMIQEYLDDTSITLTKDTNLQTDLGLSSFDYFAFVTEIQDKFNIKISDKDFMNFRTVGDVVDFIESKQKPQ